MDSLRICDGIISACRGEVGMQFGCPGAIRIGEPGPRIRTNYVFGVGHRPFILADHRWASICGDVGAGPDTSVVSFWTVTAALLARMNSAVRTRLGGPSCGITYRIYFR